jgi:23S rRNA (cytidine1920-2'-O)/16S rRNA (cytidine1409-2'-O)-methyltransferase
VARAVRRRLDEVLVDRGFARSRNAARGLIMAGLVKVGGVVSDKAGTAVSTDAEIIVRERPRFVSRGGDKLAGALKVFGVDARDASALDVGASTGGFVDCLLQAGAARVVAVDVGRGQLNAGLRADDRVYVLERVNARYLKAAMLPFAPNLLTMDVSFISVSKVLPAAVGCMAAEFAGLVLVKPQFEAGPRDVGKNGIVRDPEVRREVLRRVGVFVIDALDADLLGLGRSEPAGVGGNVEFFMYIGRGRGKGMGLDRLETAIARSGFADDHCGVETTHET